MQSDWFASLGGERFDLVVSNPPYVAAADPHLQEGDLRFEPRVALTPGGDGLTALRAIVAGAKAHLVAGGHLVVEHGYDQSAAVQALFRDAGIRPHHGRGTTSRASRASWRRSLPAA